jgi:phosphoribosylglycinamide formyltransferase-1
VNIAVLASHAGTTLQAVLDACERGAIAARVTLVISNNAESGALERARRANVPALHLSSRTHPEPAALDQAIRDALIGSAADIVLLAGYMKRLGPATLAAFSGRVLNTHPALLPKFGGHGMYGEHVHRAVLAAHEPVTGASIHRVDENYDTGAVIAQVTVAVEPQDTPQTLAARVQQSERQLIVEVLAEIAQRGAHTGQTQATPP